MVADGFLQEATERTETYQRVDAFGLFTEENEGDEDLVSAYALRASFSSLSSVQISESEQRLVPEVISSVPSVGSCKTRCRVLLGLTIRAYPRNQRTNQFLRVLSGLL
jgi:hypothetical protein